MDQRLPGGAWRGWASGSGSARPAGVGPGRKGRDPEHPERPPAAPASRAHRTGPGRQLRAPRAEDKPPNPAAGCPVRPAVPTPPLPVKGAPRSHPSPGHPPPPPVTGLSLLSPPQQPQPAPPAPGNALRSRPTKRPVLPEGLIGSTTPAKKKKKLCARMRAHVPGRGARGDGRRLRAVVGGQSIAGWPVGIPSLTLTSLVETGVGLHKPSPLLASKGPVKWPVSSV